MIRRLLLVASVAAAMVLGVLPAMAAGHHLITDPAGDGGVLQVGPNDPALDILTGDMGYDATTQDLTIKIGLADLSHASGDREYLAEFVAGNTQYYVRADVVGGQTTGSVDEVVADNRYAAAGVWVALFAQPYHPACSSSSFVQNAGASSIIMTVPLSVLNPPGATGISAGTTIEQVTLYTSQIASYNDSPFSCCSPSETVLHDSTAPTTYTVS